jgi:hypothetical protein
MNWMNDETQPDAQQPNPADSAADAGGTKPDGEAPTEGLPADGQDNGGNAAATDDKATPDGEADKSAEGQPVVYEAFQLPEGFVLEGERLEQANTLFNELGLDQAKAQRAIDVFCELSGKDAGGLTEALNKATEDARAQQIETWGVESKAEFGEKYDPMVQKARLAVSVLESDRPNIKQTFDTLGWGNHPDLVFAFAKMGELLGESTMDTGGGGGKTPRALTLEERMYPQKT